MSLEQTIQDLTEAVRDLIEIMDNGETPAKSNSKAADDEKPKRGRGRPAKAAAAGDDGADKPKRGRGRPAKAAAADDDSADKPKRGRGRPAKAAKQEEEEDDLLGDSGDDPDMPEEVTEDDLKAVTVKLVNAGKRDAALKVLKSFGATKISELNEEDFDEAYEKLSEIAA